MKGKNMSEEDKVFVGKTLWFSNKKGYGFAEWYKDGAKQKDIFLHFAHIVDQPGFRSLKAEDKVEFKIGANLRGQPIAVEVKKIL